MKKTTVDHKKTQSPQIGYLVLENGMVFKGVSFGAYSSDGDIHGEVVFCTGMVGYPEAFTDPSFYGQILTLTFPLIGNYGVPDTSTVAHLSTLVESDKMHIRGLIVSSYVEGHSHWQSQQTLSAWLQEAGVPALSGIDTRTLTQILRETGVMKGKITFTKPDTATPTRFVDINAENIVAKVSIEEPIIYGDGPMRVLFFDCGAKHNQIRLLMKQGATVIRVPWDYDPWSTSLRDVNRSNPVGTRTTQEEQITDGIASSQTPRNDNMSFDAIMISNGPGDPKMADKTVAVIKQAIEKKIPILGVCLGNQILALASGANTYKLKYGHRSQNQPVRDERTGMCYVTTQNHGFAVDTNTLQPGWKPWFTNLNDGTNEGIRHESLPMFSSQFHPESTPGPTDTEWIFEYFIEEAKKYLATRHPERSET